MHGSPGFEELMRQVADCSRQLEELEQQFQALGDVEIAVSFDELQEELGTISAPGGMVVGGLRA